MSDEKQKPSSPVHLSSFMDGKMSPVELHRALAFGGHVCDGGGCGQPAAIRIRVFAEAAEAIRRSPEYMAVMAAQNEGKIPVVDFKYGKFVRVGQTYACERCRAEAERAAAKAPSWCIVEIDDGPKDIPIQESVPEALEPKGK